MRLYNIRFDSAESRTDFGISMSGISLSSFGATVGGNKRSTLRSSLLNLWVWLSGGLSLACAVHCALVPLMFVLLPTLKMALFSVRDPNHSIAIFLMQSVRYEQPLVWLGLIIAGLSLLGLKLRGAVKQLRFHRIAWVLYAIGATLTLAGAYSPAREVLQHASLMLSGGLLLLAASLTNARAARCSA